MRPESGEKLPSVHSILIVDDHPVLRRGLAALIGGEPDLRVAGAVATRQAALLALRDSEPALVLVDIGLTHEDGLDLIKDMKSRHPRVPGLVLSMHDESVYGERALRAGARGYVSKQQLDETVLQAIRLVLAGSLYMSVALQRRLAERYVGGRTLGAEPGVHSLSDRELQVFRLIGEGRTTKQIAETLMRSVKTVESHIEHIKGKLNVTSAARLAQSATRWVETGNPG